MKTLEGEKKTMEDRSASLSSNTSDKGVDVTGGTSDLIPDFQLNEKKDGKNKDDDLFILPRIQKRSLAY